MELNSVYKISRRCFLYILGLATAEVTLMRRSLFGNRKETQGEIKHETGNIDSKNLGVSPDGKSYVYFARNGTPEENIRNVIEMMGGINRLIGRNDIVVLKPNAQRYNQGMTNTNALKGFIELVLGINNFKGEVIIAENHHYQHDEIQGWITDKRNGEFNLNELVKYFNQRGYPNVTKYHLHDAGSNNNPIEGDACCGKKVNGPEDGDGYVWCEDIYYASPIGRKCLMTYPIFTSSYSGVTIDLKNGAWEKGKYTGQPVKLVNFSALNHHGRYAGVTASVKNLMGIVDLTCGFHGDQPKDCYNVHFIGVSKKLRWLDLHWRLKYYKGTLKDKFVDFCYKNFHHTGGTLGYFMKTIRLPDLNIIAADLVGWGDRKDLSKAFKPRAMLASKDPVALDYIAAKSVLLPGTPEDAAESGGKAYRYLNDPDVKEGPCYKFLKECHLQGVGNLEEKYILVKSSIS